MRYCIYCFLPIFLLYGVAFWVSGPSAFGILDTFSEQHIHSTFEVAKLISFLGLRLVQALVYLSACLHILFFQKESINHLTSAKYFLLIYLSLSWEMPLSSIHQFTWILPFLLFLIVHNKKWSKLFYLFVVTIFLGGLRSRHDAFGIFAPLNPELFLSLPSLKDITGYFFNQNVYDQMINFSFKVISTIFIILILRSLYMRPIKSTS